MQQAKDNSLISRQVLHEYDSKFVHPALQKPCRDVGIQTISKNRTRDSSVGVKGSSSDLASSVVTYTPTTIVNRRTFRTNPNASYASQYDPDDMASPSVTRSLRRRPSLHQDHSSSQYASTSTATGPDFSSPINTHAASPLRKSASANFIKDGERSASRGRDSLGGAFERRASPSKRDVSPLKRISLGNLNAERERGEKTLGQAGSLGRSTQYGSLGVGRRESGRY